jgi:hypothetical protein
MCIKRGVMLRKKPDCESNPEYPSYDEYHRNRRRFLKGMGAGVAASSLFGCTESSTPGYDLGGIVCPPDDPEEPEVPEKRLPGEITIPEDPSDSENPPLPGDIAVPEDPLPLPGRHPSPKRPHLKGTLPPPVGGKPAPPLLGSPPVPQKPELPPEVPVEGGVIAIDP